MQISIKFPRNGLRRHGRLELGTNFLLLTVTRVFKFLKAKTNKQTNILFVMYILTVIKPLRRNLMEICISSYFALFVFFSFHNWKFINEYIIRIYNQKSVLEKYCLWQHFKGRKHRFSGINQRRNFTCFGHFSL